MIVNSHFFNVECENLRGKWSECLLKILPGIDMEDYFHNKSICNITSYKEKFMSNRILKKT